VEDVLNTKPPIVKFIEELKTKVQVKCKTLDTLRSKCLLPFAKEYLTMNEKDQKRYFPELVFREIKEKEYVGFFLNYRGEIILDLQRKSVEAEAFAWIKKNWTKFRAEWRDTLIPELIDKHIK
jgi:hypothetical protein